MELEECFILFFIRKFILQLVKHFTIILFFVVLSYFLSINQSFEFIFIFHFNIVFVRCPFFNSCLILFIIIFQYLSVVLQDSVLKYLSLQFIFKSIHFIFLFIIKIHFDFIPYHIKFYEFNQSCLFIEFHFLFIIKQNFHITILTIVEPLDVFIH